ncbi:hypothetical protein BC835DRAFT_1417896 [Cytidiella melzeri]|nr:hypothetical protein BC835DRAFT_1417896 [Cytidiella melzeri]
MGQSWQLTNIDKRCSPHGGAKLGEFFHDGLPVWIDNFIIPCPLSSTAASLFAEYPRMAHCSSSPKSRLLRCPNEILLLVFQEIDELHNAASLALADGKLLKIGLRRIEELQRHVYCSWAGDRVLCIGDYTDDDDYPDSVKNTVEVIMQNLRDHAEEYPYIHSFYSAAAESAIFRRFQESQQVRGVNKLGLELRRRREDASDLYEALVSPNYPPVHEWVLCNISKGEYVRQTSIEAINKNKKMDVTYDLGHALLSRICWSSDDSISMPYKNPSNPLHRGSWAGDRFEVTTLDKLRPDIAWRDVSEEVADTLREIYRCDFG